MKPPRLLFLLLPALAACDCGSASSFGVGSDAGTGMDGSALDATLPGVGRIVINELVVYATQDWSHSDRVGEPFDRVPGNGDVGSSDQWVELKNVDSGALDLTGWSLEVFDASDDVTVLGTSNVVLLFSEGSSLASVMPGHFVLIGNPVGHMSTDAFVVLRDADGQVVDDVEIGGLSDGRDYEADGVGDGAPHADYNGFSRGAFEEAVARPLDSVDTDDDQTDFVRMPATPLDENRAREIPNELDPPVLLGVTQGTEVQVNIAARVIFDETVDPACADGAVVLREGTRVIPLGPNTYDKADTRIVLNPIGVLPFDADITVEVRGGATGVCDLAGNRLPTDMTFTFHTEAAPVVPGVLSISELCLDPQQDWNQGGSAQAFSQVPGSGQVTSDDEWIELLASGSGIADVRSYRIEHYNGFSLTVAARSQTLLSTLASAVRVFGTGELEALDPGDYVVIGNPAGAMQDDVMVLLRDGNGALIDVVEVGGNVAERDRGGDGIRNGAPGAGQSGGSSGLETEGIVRVGFSGNDITDWEYATATLGADNSN